jgi:hypothetical protein
MLGWLMHTCAMSIMLVLTMEHVTGSWVGRGGVRLANFDVAAQVGCTGWLGLMHVEIVYVHCAAHQPCFWWIRQQGSAVPVA